MSKWEKPLARILSISADIRFEELEKVLTAYGYSRNNPHRGSSHYTFRKSNCTPITITKHNTIKKVYVEKVKNVIENEEAINEDAC